jgi:hypothetical protein
MKLQYQAKLNDEGNEAREKREEAIWYRTYAKQNETSGNS